MNAGVTFTERYLKLMFKSLRDATPEEVLEELEHCRRENRRPVRVPRCFRGYFTEEKYHASTGFEMQVFKHEEKTRSLRPRFLNLESFEVSKESKGRQKKSLILYIHGGAFIYPPVFFHWRFLHDLALRTHCDTLMPVYPKSPEYVCEYSVRTLLDFYQSISSSKQYEEIHLVGDSAGACLCLVVAQEAHKNGWQKPATTTLLSPCVDLSHTKAKEMRALQEKDNMLQLDRVIALNAIWQAELPAKHPWVSPVFGNFRGIDNLSVYFGSDEILQPDDLFLKEVYESQGKTGHFVECEGMFHTFAMFPIPQGFVATREIATTIKKGRLF
ncbi:MAG: alpha/beta hydrolase fold domain-containing protein [Bacteroidales bacterium]|nr:alpha/beta hydrolase fold domain-containing protein [Bacteroidales bacterium]